MVCSPGAEGSIFLYNNNPSTSHLLTATPAKGSRGGTRGGCGHA